MDDRQKVFLIVAGVLTLWWGWRCLGWAFRQLEHLSRWIDAGRPVPGPRKGAPRG